MRGAIDILGGQIRRDDFAVIGVDLTAQRSKRSESLIFRIFYWLYGRLFKLLTGASISSGNFSILPFSYLRRLIVEPSVWNHYAATMIKSKIPIRYVPTVRGVRYAGQSKMKFTNLVLHGLDGVLAHLLHVSSSMPEGSC